jgi:hypothetical protein
VISQFFFTEKANSNENTDMLENYAFTQLEAYDNFIIQQNGTPLHSRTLHPSLNAVSQ